MAEGDRNQILNEVSGSSEVLRLSLRDGSQVFQYLRIEGSRLLRD